MRIRNIILIATLVCVGAFQALIAYAQEGAWRITAFDGSVRVTVPGSATIEAELSRPLATGTVITTGAASYATVENGAQKIEVRANARMTIASSGAEGMTRILQDLGTLLFDVDRRQVQHFEVQTPLLAAVVKGTKFAVTVSPEKDLVHVTSGLVEVRAGKGGASRDVAPGETASVSRDQPERLGAVVPSQEVPSEEGTDVAPLDYASISGGVVDGLAGFAGTGSSGGLPSANGGMLAGVSNGLMQSSGLVGGLGGGLAGTANVGGGLAGGSALAGGGGLAGGLTGGLGGTLGGVGGALGGVGGTLGGVGGTLGGTLGGVGGALGGSGGALGGVGGAVGGLGGAVGGQLGGLGGALGGGGS